MKILRALFYHSWTLRNAENDVAHWERHVRHSQEQLALSKAHLKQVELEHIDVRFPKPKMRMTT